MHELAARGRGAQAVPRAAGHAPQPTKVPGRCECSSSTATSCAGRARTSTTPACARRWRGPGTRSTCCARSPGPRSSTSSTRSGRGRRAGRRVGSPPCASRSACTAWRPDIGAPAARLCRRSLRGLRGAHAAGVQRRRDRRLRAGQRRRRARRVRAPLPDVALANHLVMGPAILRPRARRPRALRGEGPWQRAGVRRQADPSASCPARARASRRPAVLVGSRHTAETPVGGDAGDGSYASAPAWGRRAWTWTASARATTPPRGSRP